MTDLNKDAKVRYICTDGYVSTAYVDILGDAAKGEDKHTDEPVTLLWDGSDWREISDLDAEAVSAVDELVREVVALGDS